MIQMKKTKRPESDKAAFQLSLGILPRSNEGGSTRLFSTANCLILVSCVSLYAINQFILKKMSGNFLVHGYLNDFLAMPLLLSYSNILIFISPLHELAIRSLHRIIPFTLVVGVFWEYGTIYYCSSKVCDPYDLIVYFLGSFAYYLIIKWFDRRAQGNSEW